MKSNIKTIGILGLFLFHINVMTVNAGVNSNESKIGCHSAMKMYVNAKKICFNTKLSDAEKSKVRGYLSKVPKNRAAINKFLEDHTEFSKCVKPLKEALEAKLSAESCGKFPIIDDEN